jgi:ABC-type phosphate/phosphonate transport system substrate-binding protein
MWGSHKAPNLRAAGPTEGAPIMINSPRRLPELYRRAVVFICALLGVATVVAAVSSSPISWSRAGIFTPQTKLEVLRIGATTSLNPEGNHAKVNENRLETLRSFIKEETGYPNEIITEKDWRTLAEYMAKKERQLGVFQGYEFAWAQEDDPNLKPLALGIDVYRYPVAYIVTNRDNAAKDFSGLTGQSAAVPDTGQRYLTMFVERESQALGKEPSNFFTKVTTPDNIEDAIDDVVDGKVQAAVADRASLDSYKRRKPGRFAKLKAVAQSQPFPPLVVAYYDQVLDPSTLQRFRDGLLGANRKEKGQTLLTLFRLSGFEAIPNDFDQVLEKTRKTYPPPKKAE